MTEQLTLDGSPPRRPRVLTERQRTLMRHVRYYNDRWGALPTRAARVHYADAAGALRRLERAGLLRRDAEREWWAT